MQHPRAPISHRRKAFTVMELLVALALSSVVALAAMALMSFLPMHERQTHQRFDDRLDLLVAQGIVRTAMDSLVAARPMTQEEIEDLVEEVLRVAEAMEPQRGAGEPDRQADDARDDDASRSDDDEPDPDEVVDRADPTVVRLAEQYIEAGRDESMLADLIVESSFGEMPHFELHYVINEYENELPRLEMVVHEPPVKQSRVETPQSVPPALGIEPMGRTRGAFEVVQLEDQFVLIWQPIEPPGDATIVLDGLAGVEWWVLPRRKHDQNEGGWVDVAAAYLEIDYPLAVRLVLWTLSGEHADWLFETEAMTPGAS